MHNKTFLLTASLSIFFMVLFFSCQKFETKQVDNEPTETTLTNTDFSPDFNWESTRNIIFNISSKNSQVINITSTDKLISYHKGKLFGNSNTYVIKISVPTYVEKLNVNNQELDLNSDIISVNL